MKEIAAEVSKICKLPKPKTYLRIVMRRLKVSSKPMEKSRKTIPSSAIDFVVSVLVKTPNPKGPIAAPAKRYPKAGLKPSCLKITTMATDANNRINISLR